MSGQLSFDLLNMLQYVIYSSVIAYFTGKTRLARYLTLLIQCFLFERLRECSDNQNITNL